MSNPFIQSLKHFQLMLYTFVSGLFYFIFFSVGVTLGAGLSITIVGIPILVYVLKTGPKFVQFEVYMVRKFTSASVEQLGSYHQLSAYSDTKMDWEQMKETLTNRRYWIMIKLFLYKLVIGLVGLVLSVLLFIVPLVILPAPLLYEFVSYNVLFYKIETFPAALALSIGGFLWLIAGIRLGNSFAASIVNYTRRLVNASNPFGTNS